MGLFETRQTTQPLFKRDQKNFFQVLVSRDDTGDTNSIHDAIKMLGKSGGTIMVKAGTYEIKNPIEILADNITITGDGEATILKYTGGGLTSVFTIDGYDNIKFNNFKLWIPTNSVDGFNIIQGSKIKITGVVLDLHAFNTGIKFGLGGDDSVISECEFNYLDNALSANFAIAIGNFNRAHVSNNTINCTNNISGIYIAGSLAGGTECVETLITNNFINGNTGGSSPYGIYIDGYCLRNQILNNNIRNFSTEGININGVTNQDNIVSNNILENTTNITDTGTNTLISNNQLL
jgi:hypothetical protein